MSEAQFYFLLDNILSLSLSLSLSLCLQKMHVQMLSVISRALKIFC